MSEKIKPAASSKHLAMLQKSTIRRAWHNGEWWFVIVDVVAALSGSIQPDGYLKDLRKRKNGLSEEWGEIATLVPVKTAGGLQPTSCVNIAGLFRLVQFIPSPKAAPFKRWLAQVGYERVKEAILKPEKGKKRSEAP